MVTVTNSDVAAESIMEDLTDAETVGQSATKPSNASPSTTEVAIYGEPLLKTS
ncbi:hypothetical protein KIN20_036033 [Parelaphostrongylus tenuis]|uniref:Uncharacterized protein n=1 Tax=Parelaphostrongylus tenuis TaxID=148309 RepID=A0AAD5RCR9_PARTN|nr:hypothetical protein KIN20_036033 [Parelaphostrongylus tenuis]